MRRGRQLRWNPPKLGFASDAITLPPSSIVAERQLPLDREVCRNYRRDYFLAYPIYMPDGIGPGRYRLELTIEDRKAEGKYQGRKLGEGLIEFAIRQ